MIHDIYSCLNTGSFYSIVICLIQHCKDLLVSQWDIVH